MEFRTTIWYHPKYKKLVDVDHIPDKDRVNYIFFWAETSIYSIYELNDLIELITFGYIYIGDL